MGIEGNPFKDKSRASYDKKARNYAETFDGQFCSRMYASVLEKLSAIPVETLLDVGCGDGTLLSLVLQHNSGIRVSGIDLAPGMIKEASKALGSQAELIVGDSEHLPWKDDSFDIILCNASFHHYPEPVNVLREMNRVLKNGGTVILAEPWWPQPARFFANVIFPLLPWGDVKVYSQKEMREMLSGCGFGLIEWENPGVNYCIITAKTVK